MFEEIIKSTKVSQFKEWLSSEKSFVIIGHIGPDGDAVGSSLGLWHLLQSLGKKAQVVMPNSFPNFLEWMPGSEHIVFFDSDKAAATQFINNADVICLLDFNTLSRIGDMGEVVEQAKAKKVMVDHHLDPDDNCDITISYSQIASTSELIFRLIYQLGYVDKISKEGAECIYTGMMTDTGSFTYNSNHKDIYTIISMLLEKGIDKDSIYRKVNHTYSESRLKLMGHILSKMKVYPTHTALLTLTAKEQENFNYIKGDSEGFVNIPLSVKGMVCSCFLREETEPVMIKVSLRSVGTFPCNKMAAEFFNGGGHLNASGGEFFGTMEEAIEQFEKAIEKYKPLLLEKE